jgi:membrane-associated phospholipid phosphatase
MAGARPAFDGPLMRFAASHGGGWVDRAMRAISTVGSARVLVPVAAAVVLALLVRRRPLHALLVTVASLGAAFNPPLKELFHRARPHLFAPRAAEGGYGFPSGHAMTSMAIVGGLCALAWRTRARWPALAAGGLLVLAVGASRVELGVHYPSDVLAGWALSLAWVIGSALLVRSLEGRGDGALGDPAPLSAGAGRSARGGRSSPGRAGRVR